MALLKSQVEPGMKVLVVGDSYYRDRRWGIIRGPMMLPDVTVIDMQSDGHSGIMKGMAFHLKELEPIPFDWRWRMVSYTYEQNPDDPDGRPRLREIDVGRE
jgi:hypothetical protein